MVKHQYQLIVNGEHQVRWLNQAELALLIHDYVVTSIRKVL